MQSKYRTDMDKTIHSHLYHQVIGRLRSKRELGGGNTGSTS